MMDDGPSDVVVPTTPSPVFAEGARLFNIWLETLDAMMISRSRAAGDAAQAAAAALLAHLGAYPTLEDLAPIRARLAIVVERLRQEKPGGAP